MYVTDTFIAMTSYKRKLAAKLENKDLNDKKVINAIHNSNVKFLQTLGKNGELYANIYKGILEGKSQVEVAKEIGVSTYVINHHIFYVRSLIKSLRSAGIDLEEFKKFDVREVNRRK